MKCRAILTPEGTIILNGKPTLPAGPVKVRIETIPAPRSQADWDAAVRGLDELKDYDFDAVQRGRDYDFATREGPSSMILTDSGVLIKFMRTKDAKLGRMIHSLPIAICGAVQAELLAGTRNAVERASTMAFLQLFHYLPFEEPWWGAFGR